MMKSARIGLGLLMVAGLWLPACKTDPEKGPAATDSEVMASPPTSGGPGFVSAPGKDFMLDGKPFKFQGTNFYRLALSNYSDGEIDDIMRKYSDAGIKVIRMWGFSCDTPKEWGIEGNQMGQPILDRNGKLQEGALVKVDKVLAKAGARGIKIIFPLVNFEHEYCGMEWWNRVHGDKNESKHAFYCNANVRSAFKTYVTTILNRRNTVNGLAYKDDPAIFAIELANEPHTKDDYERKGTSDNSCKPFADGKPGTIVHKWIREMSEHVRSVDSKHMIASGEEGYRIDGDTSKHGWLHNGLKGVDYERNLQLPLISFATVHLYPDNSSVPRNDFHSYYVPQVIADRARIAHKYNKPIILEETGFGELTGDGSDYQKKIIQAGYAAERPKWLGEMYKAANAAGYSGTMVWQVVPNRDGGGAYDDDTFTFPLSSAEGGVVRAQAAIMNGGTSGGGNPGEIPRCRDASTDADEKGVKDGWGWENNATCKVP